MPAFGVDVSGWQTPEQVQGAAEDPKVEFIIPKATQGKAYVSNAWPEYRDLAGDKYLGAYHYAEPPQPVITEMDHYLRTMDPSEGDILIVDIEYWNGVANRRDEMSPEDEAALAYWVVTAVDYLREQTEAMPLVYTNWLWVPRIRRGCSLTMWEELVQYSCFLAELDEPGKHEPIDPKPGSSKSWPVLLHQFSETPFDQDWTPDINKLRSLGVK